MSGNMSGRFPRDMVVFCMGDMFFLYIKMILFSKKKNPHVLAIFLYSICLIPCRFVLVRVWRVIFAQYKTQNPKPSIILRRIPHGMVVFFWSGIPLCFFINCRNCREKYHFFWVYGFKHYSLIPLRVRFCISLECFLNTTWGPNP
jgi:hypothetical protein